MDFFDCVLLDDDFLVRLAWKMAAQRAGKKILVCSSFEELERNVKECEARLNPSVPLYIDSHLGAGQRGEDFAQRLTEMGFIEIFLATGHRSTSEPPLPSAFKGVVGKEPPASWGS